MADDWQQITIGSFCPFVYGKGLPERMRNQAGNVPVYGSNGVVGTHDRSLIDGPAIVIGRKGTVGAVHYCKERCWPIDTTFFVKPSPERDTRFTYYILSSSCLDQMNADSAVPGLNREAAHARKILVPPLDEQRAIAHILGTLDDKIELNRHMNQTLEAMAQALFKSWFVDFEPFSDQGMEDSALGPIPRGWRVDKLSETCDITMGQSPPGDTYNEIGNGIPFYQGIKDFGFRFPSHRIYCTKPTRFANVDDVLLSVRAPVGNLNMSSERCAIGRGLAALSLKKKQKGYLYYLLRTTQCVWEKFDSEGTVFGCIKKTDIHKFELIMPTESIIEKFGNLVEPSDSRITSNENESTTLAAIRDALLPKLLSGEIRVKDAGKFVERVV